MRQLLKNVFIVLFFIISTVSFCHAVDFSVLLGTWNGTIFFKGMSAPLDKANISMTFTEITPNGATGYDNYNKVIAASWMPNLNKFRIIDPTSPIDYPYYVTVTGNYMYGDYGYRSSLYITANPFTATKITDTCPTNQPTFDIESSILTLPTLCINGTTYQNIKIQFNMDGTWSIQQ